MAANLWLKDTHHTEPLNCSQNCLQSAKAEGRPAPEARTSACRSSSSSCSFSAFSCSSLRFRPSTILTSRDSRTRASSPPSASSTASADQFHTYDVTTFLLPNYRKSCCDFECKEGRCSCTIMLDFMHGLLPLRLLIGLMNHGEVVFGSSQGSNL